MEQKSHKVVLIINNLDIVVANIAQKKLADFLDKEGYVGNFQIQVEEESKDETDV